MGIKTPFSSFTWLSTLDKQLQRSKPGQTQQDLNNAIIINGSRYYNGSTAVVKLDFPGEGSPALLENLASISWMEQEQHRPIYGYADRYFKYASAGQHIVEGRIMYVAASLDEIGTILRSVKEGKDLDGSGILLERASGVRETTSLSDMRDMLFNDSVVMDIPVDIEDPMTLPTDTIEKLAEVKRKEIWEPYILDVSNIVPTEEEDDESPHMGDAPYGAYSYNIIVEYGSMLDNTMMGTDDPDSILSSKIKGRRDIIKGVLFSPPSVQLDDTGRPGAIVRSFIAKRVLSSSTNV